MAAAAKDDEEVCGVLEGWRWASGDGGGFGAVQDDCDAVEDEVGEDEEGKEEGDDEDVAGCDEGRCGVIAGGWRLAGLEILGHGVTSEGSQSSVYVAVALSNVVEVWQNMHRSPELS